MRDNPISPPTGPATGSCKGLHPQSNSLAIIVSFCEPQRPDPSKIVLEAGRVATEKMLDYYKLMGIIVTPQMTLTPEKPKRVRRKTV